MFAKKEDTPYNQSTHRVIALTKTYVEIEGVSRNEFNTE